MSGEMDPHHKDAKTQGTQDRAVTERGGIMLHLSPTAATVIAKQARPSTNTRTNIARRGSRIRLFVPSFGDGDLENHNTKPPWRLEIANFRALRDFVSWW